MDSKLEGTVNYLQAVDCILNAAKQNEELQDRLITAARGSLSTHTYIEPNKLK